MHENSGISVPSKNKTLTWLLIKFEWVRLIHTAFKPSVELLWTKNRPHAPLTGCLLLSWATSPGSMSCIHHHVTYSQAALPPVWALLTMTPISAETKIRVSHSSSFHLLLTAQLTYPLPATTLRLPGTRLTNNPRGTGLRVLFMTF